LSHQDEIAKTVWDWRNKDNADDRPKQARQNRIHGLIQGVIGLTAGCLVFFFFQHTLGLVILAIAGTLTLLALVSPLNAYASVKGFMQRFGMLVGTLTTWITLVPLYFLFFAPFHLLFRSGSRNMMQRKWDSNTDSYWHVRGENSPASSYERQF